MKAKLYIDSEDSTIKIEGGPSDVLHLLVCAIAQILKSYFPDDFERQLGWVSGLLYNTIRGRFIKLEIFREFFKPFSHN